MLRRIDGGADQLQTVAYTASDLLVVRARWVGDLWMADDPFDVAPASAQRR